MRYGFKRSLVGVSLLALSVPAYAQDAEEKTEDSKAIVVTGTLIRGSAPTGAQLTAVSAQTISELGIANTSQVLGALPQDANFNNRPKVGSFGQYQTVNSPILRYLGGGASPSMSTLLLLDGRRMPGVGTLQTAPDMDAISPGALQRVDIVPDGGSATYGADAVGGVINLITRKRFNGVEVGGHFGLADNYKAWDATVTAGKEWSNGSLWISYNHAQNDRIANADRSFVKDLDYSGATPVGNSLNCAPGSYIAGGLVFTSTPPFFAFLPVVNYPIANGAPTNGTTLNKCDISKLSTFLPSSNRHSVMAGLDVDLSESVNFSVKAYYMYRSAGHDGGPLTYTDIAATYPGFPNGKVTSNLSPTFGNHSIATTTSQTWGVSPEFKVKLGSDWQAVAFFNYGEGYGKFLSPSVNQTDLAGFVANGAFNPFTGTFASTAAGQAAKDQIAAFRGFSSGRDEITNSRVVFDGPLFSLPGGELRAAVGAEYYREKFTQRNGNAQESNLGSILPNTASRAVKSVFGELSIPLVSSLVLSAAGRYDYYSDFGGTFNPKFGLTFKPASWWTLRGNWGKSFQAPALASDAKAIPVTLNAFTGNTFGANTGCTNCLNPANTTTLLLYPGGGVNMKPQKAITWEIGTDFAPEAIPGLTASVTYYNIDFTDRIGFPSFFSPSFYSLYPSSYTMNTTANPLTGAQIAAFVAPATDSSKNALNIQQYINDPSKVYALQNALAQNLSQVKTDGIDFNVSYKHDTGFGSIFGSVGGTYVLTYKTKATPTSAFQGFDANEAVHLRMSTSLGAKSGGFLAKATWNHVGSSAVLPTAQNGQQSRVKAYNVFNLAFQYDLSGTDILKDVSLSLNVDNLFNTNPPELRGNNAGTPGFRGYTIGRFVQFGIKKKF